MGLFGGGSAPSYQMSPQYRDLTYGTVYPKLSEIIKGGGLGLDTAGLERGFKENTAASFGGAFDKVRAFSAPYGNPAAGNRMALNLGTRQAATEARGISDIRTAADRAKIDSLMGILGMTTGMEDPALKQYYADLQKYQGDQASEGATAGLLGNLATLGVSLWNPVAGAALGAGMNAGGGRTRYDASTPALRTNPRYM